jgi:hypothetical protein
MQTGKGAPRPHGGGQVVRFDDLKRRRARAKQRVLEPKVLFEKIGSEFNDVEIGPADGHWYGTVKLED